MEPSRQDAEAMLRGAGAMETAVRARAPQEHPLYAGMGLTILLIGVAADLNDVGGLAGALGAVLALAALAVTLGTNLPYLRRHRQVRVRRTPAWLEWALGLGSLAALCLLGIPLDGTVGFSFTLGGLVGAVPFLLWAERLRRTA